MIDRTIYIGDVHGCLEELEQLLDLLDYDTAGDRLCFVGDIIDRGPHSAAVVRFVRRLCERHDVRCVMGNHEEKYVRFRHRLAKVDGDASRVKMIFPPPKRAIFDQLDDDDHGWLSALPAYTIDGGVLLVHAGICPRRHRSREDLDRNKYRRRMLMLRRVDAEGKMLAIGSPSEEQAQSWSCTYDGRLGTVVYGHDPLDEPSNRRHAIGIDTSCCFGGHLTALVRQPNGQQRFVSVPARRAYAPRVLDD